VFDVIEITSVGRGDKVMVDTFPNDAGIRELGTEYGILRIDGEIHLLVIDTSDPDHPRFALRCKEEMIGITFPAKAMQEDLDVWLGKGQEKNVGESDGESALP